MTHFVLKIHPGDKNCSTRFKRLLLGLLFGLISLESQAFNWWAPIKPGPHPVTVSIIDTGHIYGHPALIGSELPGYSFVSGIHDPRNRGRNSNITPDFAPVKCIASPEITGDMNHGIQVASVVAGNGQMGVVGVNPAAKILPIRAIGRCGMSREDMMDAMRWAAGLQVPGIPDNPHPARIINISIVGGRSHCGDDLQRLIDSMTSRGIFVVAAAGTGKGGPLYGEPSNCRGVISVGSTDPGGEIASYSAKDSRITLYAPGGDLQWGPLARKKGFKVATFEHLDNSGLLNMVGATRFVAGTSYSASFVAGFISLWLSKQPELTPESFVYHRSIFSTQKPDGSWSLESVQSITNIPFHN